MRFCGTRGGQPFKSASRPVQQKNGSWACPTGTVACSAATNTDHTICVKPTEKAKCPLTFAEFIANDVNSLAPYRTSDYKIQVANDFFAFVTSTTKGDNLPIVNFHVGERPCLDSRDVAPSPGAKFYPLEEEKLKNTFKTCRTIEQFKASQDSRYRTSSVRTTEYDTQDESGVWKKIKNAPGASDFVTKDNKKNTFYSFFQRSNLDWKIECDAKHPRQ